MMFESSGSTVMSLLPLFAAHSVPTTPLSNSTALAPGKIEKSFDDWLIYRNIPLVCSNL